MEAAINNSHTHRADNLQVCDIWPVSRTACAVTMPAPVTQAARVISPDAENATVYLKTKFLQDFLSQPKPSRLRAVQLSVFIRQRTADL